jgi:hypothetical protein
MFIFVKIIFLGAVSGFTLQSFYCFVTLSAVEGFLLNNKKDFHCNPG